jgi:hypothetical protein
LQRNNARDVQIVGAETSAESGGIDEGINCRFDVHARVYCRAGLGRETSGNGSGTDQQGKEISKGQTQRSICRARRRFAVPTDTQCVWAGNAKIKIRVTMNGRTHDLSLDTNGPHQAATAEGYSIKLLSLTPAPRSNIRVDRNGYVATFEAVKLSR